MYSVYGNYDRGRVYTCTISCKFHNPLNRCPFARARPYKSCSENFSFFFSASLVIDPTDKVYTYRTKWPSKGLPELYIMTPRIGVLVLYNMTIVSLMYFSLFRQGFENVSLQKCTTKTINLMTPGAGVLMIGHGRTSENALFLFLNLYLYSRSWKFIIVFPYYTQGRDVALILVLI